MYHLRLIKDTTSSQSYRSNQTATGINVYYSFDGWYASRLTQVSNMFIMIIVDHLRHHEVEDYVEESRDSESLLRLGSSTHIDTVSQSKSYQKFHQTFFVY